MGFIDGLCGKKIQIDTLLRWFFYWIKRRSERFQSSSFLPCGHICEDHHHVTLLAQISLTLSRHHSLSSIASVKSSGLHSVSAQSCCMYVLSGRPAFARPCEEVHRSTSLMSSSQLLQQCSLCLIRLILIVILMGGSWPYSCCFVESVSSTCSVLLAAFLCSCRQDFCPYV